MPFPTIKAAGGGVSEAVIAPNLAQFARGISAVFEADFFDDAPQNTQPSVPANPALYPAYTVVDPSGVQVASGVGQVGAQSGRWTAQWIVPPDAPLSTQSGKWRIIWNMVTGVANQAARQLTRELPFDVVELRTPDTLKDLREHAYLTYQGQSERLVIRLPAKASQVSVTVYRALALSSPVPDSTPMLVGSLSSASIQEVQEQNLYGYIMDTPALTGLGEYQVVWNYRYNDLSPNETIVQKLFVPPPVFFSLAGSLKVLIDKLQKKSGTIHDYNTADIYEYFLRGLGYLNAPTPVTNWDLQTFPYTAFTVRFLIEGAALWALQAQHLLAGEIKFGFQGQTVQLDVDHEGVYSEVVQRLMEDLGGDGKMAWPNTKIGLMRALTPIGQVSNRTLSRYAPQRFSVKINSYSVGSGDQTLFGSLPGTGVGLGFTLTDLTVYLGLA